MLEFWRDKKVLVTGNTGFKGTWLTTTLLEFGAHVTGLSLPICEANAFWSSMEFEKFVVTHEIDLSEPVNLGSLVEDLKPDIVFHLAAQPLVRASYADPVYSWKVNVIGTAALLDAVRHLTNRCSVVVVTTDKVYENNSSQKVFSEFDPLGGHDPYSASKAATELLASSMKRSFYDKLDNLSVATARAGNVIGGGDWSVDRLVPDIARAKFLNLPLKLRNPQHKRPWQHVLEPINGYLLLAQSLYENELQESTFNFGPEHESVETTINLLKKFQEYWHLTINLDDAKDSMHEASELALCSKKAKKHLNYCARWDLNKTVEKTVNWYDNVAYDSHQSRSITAQQVKEFFQA